MGRKINCTDCLNVIDGDEDEFCMVVPHGNRYSHKPLIPLCPDCRAEQRYDIRASYRVVGETTRISQPDLPRLQPPRLPPPREEKTVESEIEYQTPFNNQISLEA